MYYINLFLFFVFTIFNVYSAQEQPLRTRRGIGGTQDILSILGQQLPRTTNQINAFFKGEIPSLCDKATASTSIIEPGNELSIFSLDTLQLQFDDLLNANNFLEYDSEEIAEQLLQIIANYTVFITASVHSPAEGCWAIAQVTVFDEDKSVFVDLLRNSLSLFEESDVIAAFDKLESESEGVIREIFNFVGLQAASSSGSQVTEDASTGIVQDSRISFLGCVLEQLILVEYGEMSSSTVAFSKCFTVPVVPKASPIACRCRKFGDQPLGCANHGDIEESICYVADPDRCTCAVPSALYPGMRWRYCGQSMQEMSIFLSINDIVNGVQGKSQDGYCEGVNFQQD
eukprot:TRINITY_DN16585_c0_g2_i2.p1 TRINITY_DN16585_c0_g2~~TRINITY_DN16585_c0_g2_i2.p1  ORF type:complete len:343 (+),score=32.76 TRINITY_DN16585_c0_g2_i2:96-1124(+)